MVGLGSVQRTTISMYIGSFEGGTRRSGGDSQDSGTTFGGRICIRRKSRKVVDAREWKANTGNRWMRRGNVTEVVAEKDDD